MSGENTLAAIDNTPMVELPSMYPYNGASIFVKWERANPTGSLKDRMALAMIEEARQREALEPEDQL